MFYEDEKPAGEHTFKGPDDNARACMDFQLPPQTPPEVHLYRRASRLEPGKRFISTRTEADATGLRLQERIYGVTSDAANDTTEKLISRPWPSLLQRINDEREEKKYKSVNREPLGSTYQRHYNMPEAYTKENRPFGLPPQHGEGRAKDVLFPTNHVSEKDEEIYIRSHGRYGPGEQINRKYQWNYDPEKTVFGVKGDSIAFNGVSKNIEYVLKGAPEDEARLVNTKNAEDRRSLTDRLGKVRNLGMDTGKLDPHHSFGVKSDKNQWGTAETIRGDLYGYEEDKDIGKSITPGFRNTTSESRAFGCPSIRTDLVKGKEGSRSCADTQNYGDDPSAKELIRPPPFSDMNFSPEVMFTPCSKERLVGLMDRIGFTAPEEVNDYAFAKAAQLRGFGDRATFSDFRDILNTYFDAVETGRENIWREQHLETRRRW